MKRIKNNNIKMSNTQFNAESEIMKTTNSIIIREAAFTRLLQTIVGFKKNDDFFADCLINGPESDDDENKQLNDNLQRMIEDNIAISRLQMVDMDKIAKIALKIVRFYESEKDLTTKINMCCAIQLAGSQLLSVGLQIEDKNRRAKELNELNNQIYKLSQEISGKKVVATTEPIDVENGGNHNNSKYFVFTVK